MRISGRSALVTGATGGLGKAICRELAHRGARIIMSGRRAEVLEPLARELGARPVVCDLADRDELWSLLSDVGEVDILVANAGVPADGLVDEYTPDQIDRALQVNLRAPILTAHALMPGMVERGSGHMVFMSSLSGKAATPGSALYSATKFGLRGFASALRQDLWDTGVGVSAIFPGPIREAGMFAQARVEMPAFAATRRPRQVGLAVVRAIERNRGEIDVASPPLRWACAVAGVAPSAIAGLNRRLGAARIAEQLARSEAHRSAR
ncbi:MAG TPA: SDR family NAD(P)-dependent oxidoreductase [Solirubrobacteraceae bacterium]|nr:SDR family NAD(P)-dependent oxidoreductase [Solirubrobacteraceae bacterium]